jgi:hypothetical protein
MADFAGVLLDLDAQVFAGGELIFGNAAMKALPVIRCPERSLPPPINSRASSSRPAFFRRGGRQYGKIAQIASLARGSILSHIKVYYPSQATGLKQLFVGIVQGLR